MAECDNFFPGELPPVTVPESFVDAPDGSDPPWITIVMSEGCSTEVQVGPGCTTGQIAAATSDLPEYPPNTSGLRVIPAE